MCKVFKRLKEYYNRNMKNFVVSLKEKRKSERVVFGISVE